MAQCVLERFGPATQDWFRGAFAEPTAAQIGAWDAISHGKHALVVAPTGSGKTLSAFLWAIDRIFHEKDAAPRSSRQKRRRADGCRALPHPDPLHLAAQGARRRCRAQPALAARRHRPVRAPPRHRGARASRVGVRSGDTTSSDRRKLVTAPPDILITTPESLYLMLTSQAGETLKNVHTVIVDEVHAVAATKRGAHLAVSLERLDALARASPRSASGCRRRCGRSTRSRGSSAARRPSRSSRRARRRRSTCAVIVPVDDMLNPPPPPGADAARRRRSRCGADAPIDEDWFGDGRRQAAVPSRPR